jgi:hypothetical protein
LLALKYMKKIAHKLEMAGFVCVAPRVSWLNDGPHNFYENILMLGLCKERECIEVLDMLGLTENGINSVQE